MIADWMHLHLSEQNISKKDVCESMAQEAFNAFNEYLEEKGFDTSDISVVIAQSDFCIKARKAAVLIDEQLHIGTARAYDVSAI
tara:strand:- start:5823 stop:6074 length:252 start_codon:yes stop_codon:yes gene_type:complete